jgi:hypothetical protein
MPDINTGLEGPGSRAAEGPDRLRSEESPPLVDLASSFLASFGKKMRLVSIGPMIE